MIAEELIGLLGFQLKGEHNLRKFTQGMGVAAKRARAFARTIGIAGAAAGAAAAAMAGTVFRMTDTVARDLDAIGKVSDKVGMSVEELQQFRYAASQMAGVTQQTADMALQRFARRIGEAANGGGELKATIDALGIELRNADGSLKSTHTLLGEFADAVAGAKSEQEALAYVFKAFDSEGGPLVTMMRQGSEAMKAAEKQAIGLGLIMSQDAVEASTKFNDAQDRSRRILEAFRRMVAVELLPTFTSWMDRFQGFWKESIANGSVDRWATQISDAILAVFDAIRSFGLSGTAILDFIKNLTGAKSRVQAFLIALAGIGAIVAPWATALILTGLLIDDFAAWLQGRESVIGDAINAIGRQAARLNEHFEPEIERAKQIWRGLEEFLQEKEAQFADGFFEEAADSITPDRLVDLAKGFDDLGESIANAGGKANDLRNVIRALSEAKFGRGDGMGDRLRELSDLASRAAGKLAARLTATQIEGATGTARALSEAIDGVSAAMEAASRGEWGQSLQELWSGLSSAGGELVSTLGQITKALFPNTDFEAAWDRVKGFFEGIEDWFDKWINRINALFASINWPQPPQWWRDLVGANEEASAGAAVGAAIVQPRPQAQGQGATLTAPTSSAPDKQSRLSDRATERVNQAHAAPAALPPEFVDRLAEISAVFQDFAARTTPEAATEMIANDNRVDSRDQSVTAPVTVNQTLTTVQQMAPAAAKAAGRNTGNAVAQQSRVAAEPAR